MRFGIVANPNKYAIKESLDTVSKWCNNTVHSLYFIKELNHLMVDNHERFVPCSSEAEVIQQSDIIIAVGGDGTMLHAARLIGSSGIPVMGINTGRLGFLATLQQENVIEALNQLVLGNYTTESRYFLSAEDQYGNHYSALNEFLFSKKGTPAMITIEAWLDHQFINRYWADGLIVASPTGSTAYNLASNGPIVVPFADVMVLTPICPHTLTTRPMVVPGTSKLKLRVVTQPHEVLFSYDGLVYEIETYPFEVTITRSTFTIKMIQLSGQSYFDTLRTKLMWGKDYRE